MSEIRILSALAEELDLDADEAISLGFSDAAGARAELDALGTWSGDRVPVPSVACAPAVAGGITLASWRPLLDLGMGQDGQDSLAATARKSVARLSASTAAKVGAANGSLVTISTSQGAITLALEITEMVDDVVWVPMNSAGSRILTDLGVLPGATVDVSGGAA
jgi:NADH-quinone oxidoreductase subunit G